MKMIENFGLRALKRLGNETGATMVEYALMIAFIALLTVAAVAALGTNLSVSYNAVAGLFP